jgi:hypothetical protein
MKRVLIADGRLCDIVQPGADFPVHQSMQWVDAPDDVSPATHEWDGAALVVKPTQPRTDPRASASLTRMEFMLALDAAGLLDDAEAFVAAADTPRQAKIMWSNASRFERSHPTLVAMATAMDLTDAQMDAVFGI